MGISFRRPQHKFFPTLWNAPKPEIEGTVEAEKTSVARAMLFWGCLVMNFRAKLPFHGMGQVPIYRDCSLLKEIPMAPDTLFQKSKLIRKSYFYFLYVEAQKYAQNLCAGHQCVFT